MQDSISQMRWRAYAVGPSGRQAAGVYQRILSLVGAQVIILFFDTHFSFSPAGPSGTSDSVELLSEAELEPACWSSRSEMEMMSSSAEERDMEVEEEDQVAVWDVPCRVTEVLEGHG